MSTDWFNLFRLITLVFNIVSRFIFESFVLSKSHDEYKFIVFFVIDLSGVEFFEIFTCILFKSYDGLFSRFDIFVF